jgi:myosin-light-chain kinase
MSHTMGSSVSGLSPFLGDTDADTYVNVTKGEWHFDPVAFARVSTRAKDFISKLMCWRRELSDMLNIADTLCI